MQSSEEKKTVIGESASPEAQLPELSEAMELESAETLISEDEIASLSKAQLIDKLDEFIATEDIQSVANLARLIKDRFDELAKEEREHKLKLFMQDGSPEEEFEAPVDPLDEKFENLYKSFNKKRADQRKQKEKSSLENLAIKKLIIEELKELMKSDGNFSTIYNKFQALQTKWRATGNVPLLENHTLRENHHFLTGKFYDMVKISNELRELDKKKTVELKTQLCERVEKLTEEPSLKKASNELRYLQKEWRETGHLNKELGDDLWTRFKTSADNIHKREKEHLAQLKQQQQANLVAKTALCEELEALSQKEINSFKMARDASEKAETIWAQWQKISFVPKSDNGNCWKRFKKERQHFYHVMDMFYAKQRQEFGQNLQKKVDLCVKAESLQESSEWNVTAETLKKLQVEWKNIGPVARKDSDAIWNRFRKACDHFFNNKLKQAEAAEGALKVNVTAKEALISKINAIQPGADISNDINELKQLQEEWLNAGEVPLREESRLNNTFGMAVEKLLERMKAGSPESAKLVHRIKYEQMLKSPKGVEQIKRERSAIKDNIKKLEAELTKLENNLSFFGNSKTTNPLIAEYTEKANQGKIEINELRNQLKSIPSVDPPVVDEVVPVKKGQRKKY